MTVKLLKSVPLFYILIEIRLMTVICMFFYFSHGMVCKITDVSCMDSSVHCVSNEEPKCKEYSPTCLVVSVMVTL